MSIGSSSKKAFVSEFKPTFLETRPKKSTEGEILLNDSNRGHAVNLVLNSDMQAHHELSMYILEASRNMLRRNYNLGNR